MADYTEWMAEHKGPLIDTIAEIWYCGDDDCGCSQAQIVERYQNLKAPRFVVRVNVWSGNFFTEHEDGAESELAAKRAAMLRDQPVAAAAICWPPDLGVNDA